jgi:hypothetical protein
MNPLDPRPTLRSKQGKSVLRSGVTLCPKLTPEVERATHSARLISRLGCLSSHQRPSVLQRFSKGAELGDRFPVDEDVMHPGTAANLHRQNHDQTTSSILYFYHKI